LEIVVGVTGLAHATDGGAVFVSWGPGAVFVQYRSGAIGNLLCGGSDDYYRAALFDVIGVKFLFANVVWLFAGKVANFPVFEMAAGTEQTFKPVAMWFVGLCGWLARRICGPRVMVDVGDYFHLVARNARYLQILNSGFRISVTLKNSDDHVLHGLNLRTSATILV
jgi:hypothetical protein